MVINTNNTMVIREIKNERKPNNDTPPHSLKPYNTASIILYLQTSIVVIYLQPKYCQDPTRKWMVPGTFFEF